MNETQVVSAHSSNRVPHTGALLGLAAISLPFWIGAIALGLRAIQLPDTATILGKAHLCQATIFALGMALGISGSGMALWAVADRPRLLGLSGTLLGTAFVVLSLMMGWFLARATAHIAVSPLPFAVPSLLVLVALLLAVKAIRGRSWTEEQEDDAESEVSEEPQSPQSQS